jgi:glucuronate isomerase
MVVQSRPTLEDWRTFCEAGAFRGTPSRYWLEHELVEVFGVDLIPSAETADAIYDKIAACVADPSFRPRALLDRFNIEVISTTDPATSDLRHHAKLAADGLGERVLPTFRPDARLSPRSAGRRDAAEPAKAPRGKMRRPTTGSGRTTVPGRRGGGRAAVTATCWPTRPIRGRPGALPAPSPGRGN